MKETIQEKIMKYLDEGIAPLVAAGAVGGGIVAAITALTKRRDAAKDPKEKESLQKQIDQKKEQLRDKKGRFAKE
jgi:hypothetical protein